MLEASWKSTVPVTDKFKVPLQSAPFGKATFPPEVRVAPAPKVAPPKVEVPLLVKAVLTTKLGLVFNKVEFQVPPASTTTVPNVLTPVGALALKVTVLPLGMVKVLAKVMVPLPIVGSAVGRVTVPLMFTTPVAAPSIVPPLMLASPKVVVPATLPSANVPARVDAPVTVKSLASGSKVTPEASVQSLPTVMFPVLVLVPPTVRNKLK